MMWDILQGMCLKGEDCDMLCALDSPSLREGDVLPVDGRIVINSHGSCFCVPAITKKAATMISPAMVVWLRRHCREYDVIHVHHPDPMAALALFFSGYRGKVVLHWHSDILKQRFILFFYRPLQNWLARRADLITGTTPVYVEQTPHLKNFREKLSYVPIGVEDYSIFQQKSLNLSDVVRGRRVVFSLGRLVEYKGYEHLVDAAKFLPDGYLTVIGGSGPLEKNLRERIADNGLEGKVLLTGYLDDAQAHAWMKACDVFVLSSIYRTEAFGIVQIEAMSCGKPVVATLIPGSGTSWVNADGVSGRNVPVGDPRAIADAVLGITSSDEVYEGYSRRARKRYEELFTRERMIEKLVEIYRSL